jgi:hypothetical protein
MGAGLYCKKQDEHRATTRTSGILFFFSIFSFHKKGLMKSAIKANGNGYCSVWTPEEWTENWVMVIFGVHWRIGFEYQRYCPPGWRR